MTSNLIAAKGTVVHAPAAAGTGSTERVTLCSNMRRSAGYEIKVSAFTEADAEVTCKNCCRILGTEAPKTVTRRRPVKATRTVSVDTEADIEARRIGTMEWATMEARFEGGTAMDALHGAALAMDSFRKPARRR